MPFMTFLVFSCQAPSIIGRGKFSSSGTDSRFGKLITLYTYVNQPNSTSSGRERPEPQEHRGHPSALLPVLHPPVRTRAEADRPGVHAQAAVQGQSHPGRGQGGLPHHAGGQG